MAAGAAMVFSCKTAPTVAIPSAPPALPKTEVIQYATFNQAILPLLERSCSPCHFPPNGKVAHFNTEELALPHAKDMVSRVQLPADDPHFMPFKSKRQALSPEEILILKEWAGRE